MLRKFAIPLILVCLAAWCAFSIGCGGSSSSSIKNCTATYDVVGDWNITLNGTAGDGGVINTSGLALFFDSFGDVLAFPSLTGACSFSGTATLYASTLGGGGSGTTSVTGNVNSAVSISGTYSTSSGSAQFSVGPLTPLTGSVSALSQSMLAEIRSDPNADIWQLSVAPSGTQAGMTFSGPNTSNTCTITGTFTQEGTSTANLNVFDVSITFSGTGCPNSGTLTGLGFESSSDYFSMNGNAAGTYLYAISSSTATVLEIFP